MSNLNKMNIDLKEFFIKGHINGIKPGISKDEFLGQYPKPDAFDTDPELFMDNSSKECANIWTYGAIEFFFNSSRILYNIWCDHIGDFFGKLKSGPSIELNRWFLEEKTTIRCIDLIEILNHENLDFSRTTIEIAQSVELQLDNGIHFTFHLESPWSEGQDDFEKRLEETSFNDYTLSAFSLMDKELMC